MLLNQKFFRAPHSYVNQVSIVKNDIYNGDHIVVTDKDGKVMRPLTEESPRFFNYMRVSVVPKEGYAIRLINHSDKVAMSVIRNLQLTAEKMVQPHVFVKLTGAEYTPSEEVMRVIGNGGNPNYSASAKEIDAMINSSFLHSKTDVTFDLTDERGQPMPLSLRGLVSDSKSFNVEFLAVRRKDVGDLRESLLTMADAQRHVALDRKDQQHKYHYRYSFTISDVRYVLIVHTPDCTSRLDQVSYFKTLGELANARDEAIRKAEEGTVVRDGLAYFYNDGEYFTVDVYIAIPDDTKPEDVASNIGVFKVIDVDAIKSVDEGYYLGGQFIESDRRQPDRVVVNVNASNVRLVPNIMHLGQYGLTTEQINKASTFDWAHNGQYGRSKDYVGFNTLNLAGGKYTWADLTDEPLTADEYAAVATALKMEDPKMKSMDVGKQFDAGADPHDFQGIGRFLGEDGIKATFTDEMVDLTIKKAMIPVFRVDVYIDLYADLDPSKDFRQLF